MLCSVSCSKTSLINLFATYLDLRVANLSFLPLYQHMIVFRRLAISPESNLPLSKDIMISVMPVSTLHVANFVNLVDTNRQRINGH